MATSPSRASSVYSTESMKKPTYLCYRASMETTSGAGTSTPATRDDGESSLSAPSRPSPSTTASRDTARSSPRPSFMNYRDGREEKIAPVPITIPERSPARIAAAAVAAPSATAPPKPAEAQGLLVLAAIAELHPRTMHYLDLLLTRQLYSGIAIVGSKEQQAAIKQLKMDVYALVGRLRQEVIVSTHVLDDWRDEHISAVIRQVSRNVGGVSGVVCTPAYERPLSTGAVDVLSLDRDELRESWMCSVGFLHAVAKCTIPMLLENGGRSVFLMLAAAAASPASLLNQTTCETLVNQLREAYSGQALTIGHAEDELIPEAVTIQRNGDRQSVGPVFLPSESPTKLWNMWALQNEIGE